MANLVANDIDTFGIALPDAWMRIPPEREAFDKFVRVQRRRLSESGEISATAARQFDLLMRHLWVESRRNDARLVATMFTVLTENGVDDGETHDPGLLSASCTINTIDRVGLGTDLPLTVNTIAAAMGRTPTPDRDGTIVDNLEPPTIIELPVGRAVQVVRRHTHGPALTTGERQEIVARHVLVPFDDGQRAVVVTFSTMSVEYARPLSRLFDKMIQTFRMFGGDAPTDPTNGPRPDGSTTLSPPDRRFVDGENGVAGEW